MPTQTLDPKFEQTKEKIVTLITQEYERNRLELAYMMALFFVLGQARNEDELLRLSNIFADNFPVLNEFLGERKATIQEKMEKDVHVLIQKVVKENPMLAAQIAQKAMEEGMTLEKLLKLHPELNKYKN